MKTALVTGGSRGIGKAIALELGKSFNVAVGYSSSKDSAEEVVEQIVKSGGTATAIQIDVANSESIENAFTTIEKELNGVDILINNAGITKDNLVFRMGEEDWDAVLNTNLKSVFTFTKYLARPMTRKRWGRIINIASVIGLTGNAGQANYSAAKAGIIGLSKSLAKEFAARNVTVNVVAPGFIETDMTSILSEEQNR